MGIAHRLTSVGHSQSNGKAEVTHQTLLQDIRQGWIKQKGGGLKSSITCYGPTKLPNGSLQEKLPLSWFFRTETIIPLEIGLSSFRVEKLDKVNNSCNLQANLDLLDEVRE